MRSLNGSFLTVQMSAVALAVYFVCGTSSARAAPTLIDNVHADIAIPYISSAPNQFGFWSPHVHTGVYNTANNYHNYLPQDAWLVANASTHRLRVGPLAGPQFDFLGVAPGESVWILSQHQVPGQLYLGQEADRRGLDDSFIGQVPPGNEAQIETRMLANNATNWMTWDPDGVGPTVPGRYVEVALVAMRGPPGGHFSVWQNDIAGPRVLMDTADGIAQIDGGDNDEFHQLIRSHSHYNWAFTRRATMRSTSALARSLPTAPRLSAPCTRFTSRSSPSPSPPAGHCWPPVLRQH